MKDDERGRKIDGMGRRVAIGEVGQLLTFLTHRFDQVRQYDDELTLIGEIFGAEAVAKNSSHLAQCFRHIEETAGYFDEPIERELLEEVYIVPRRIGHLIGLSGDRFDDEQLARICENTLDACRDRIEKLESLRAKLRIEQRAKDNPPAIAEISLAILPTTGAIACQTPNLSSPA